MSLLYEENNDKILDRNTTMMFNVDTNKTLYNPRSCVNKYKKHCKLEKKNRKNNRETKKDFLNTDVEYNLFNIKKNDIEIGTTTTLNPDENELDSQFAHPQFTNFRLYESSKRSFRLPAKYGTKK